MQVRQDIPAAVGGDPIRRSKDEVPFAPPCIAPEEVEAVVAALKSGWITTGPRVEQFEKEFAQYVGARYAVATSSGSTALLLALRALDVGPGDEVITSPYTYVATANAICLVGATPVFCDIEPATINIDPDRVLERITGRTKVIIPVHFAGHPCQMDELLQIAREHDLIILQDAAHAVASRYKGCLLGTLGTPATFSFQATKNLTTADGGMVVADDPDLAERVSRDRLHGIVHVHKDERSDTPPWMYDVDIPGYKANMTDMQAALGLVQLSKLNERQRIREKLVAVYEDGLGGLDEIELPRIADAIIHSWHLYVIRLCLDRISIDRDEFVRALWAEGIRAGVHFRPIHLHSYYQRQYGYRSGDFPVAEEIFKRAVSLPIHPSVTTDDAQDVVRAVARIVNYFSCGGR
jgi:dTDP-4-amino-4,6-dideoxygalactose transaminase